MHRWLVFGTIVLAGCSKASQSKEEGMKLLCDRPQIEQLVGDAPFAEWPARLAAYKKITNADVKKTIADLEASAPYLRYDVLFKATRDYKLSCPTVGLFLHRPFSEDPADAPARAWALATGEAIRAAFVAEPFDAALQAPDPANDARRVDCSKSPNPSGPCVIPADAFPADRYGGKGASVVGTGVHLVLQKGGNYVASGFMVWDDVRARTLGGKVTWFFPQAITAPERTSIDDPDAVKAGVPALGAMVDRTLKCLVPLQCELPTNTAYASTFGREPFMSVFGTEAGDYRELLQSAADIDGWKLVHVELRALVATDTTSLENAHTTGLWIYSTLRAEGGRTYLGPITWTSATYTF